MIVIGKFSFNEENFKGLSKREFRESLKGLGVQLSEADFEMAYKELPKVKRKRGSK